MKPAHFLVLFALRRQYMKIQFFAVVFLLAMTAVPAFCNSKPAQECKVTFGVVYLDRLNNTNNGIPQKDVKDVEKKLSRFGDVCYAADKKPDLIFFIHTTPAVYHGTHVYTDNSTSDAAVTDGNGTAAAAAASSSTTTAVPYTVDYSVFILDIEIPQPDGTFKTLRTLDQKGLYNTLYGIGYSKGKHPLPNVIVAAAQWLHENNLGK
jgi:hypothetical protein